MRPGGRPKRGPALWEVDARPPPKEVSELRRSGRDGTIEPEKAERY